MNYSDKKHTKIIHVKDAFTVQKGHIKGTVAQKEAHWPPFLVFNSNLAKWVDIKKILYKKSLIHLITGTNLLNIERPSDKRSNSFSCISRVTHGNSEEECQGSISIPVVDTLPTTLQQPINISMLIVFSLTINKK